ncbi:MAG: metallophosphoesterase family protein [Chloroflexota bacterium]|nr:MAG: metallophosphoesterase family protein [Chloroflexota bacterium]
MPKLLLFSDVHSNKAFCSAIVEKARDHDIVLGAGDLGLARRHLEISTRILSQIAVPVILVPGNVESYEELRSAFEQYDNFVILHGDSCELLGYRFFGLGGGIPITPFGPWSYDFSEEQAAGLLSAAGKPDVLITHSPPVNAADQDSSGRHLGSVAIRSFVEAHQPILHVCGHIHESWNTFAKIGQTDVVNAGPHGINYTLPDR